MINVNEEKGVFKYNKIYKSFLSSRKELGNVKQAIENKEIDQNKIRRKIDDAKASFDKELIIKVQKEKEKRLNAVTEQHKMELTDIKDQYIR